MTGAQPLAGRHILVVDDFLMAQDVAASLTPAGAHVVGPAPSVTEALNLVARVEQLDAAVLDFNLRGETVYPVADALKDRSVPFVFVTGYDPDTIAARRAAVPVFEKPFNADQVMDGLCGRPD
ncbi:response regulator [Paracoccus sp. S-4012]|uniref:response regulator n=1 Tax=Paracoccus sp. S-4012 TaxID=2665648 RepID=UPI0012B076EE|nr:response regulator [Paracoccus sp. S-4012]MRX52196.1 response regulator [Paracoccus sp. S-4012]